MSSIASSFVLSEEVGFNEDGAQWHNPIEFDVT